MFRIFLIFILKISLIFKINFFNIIAFNFLNIRNNLIELKIFIKIKIISKN